MRRFPRFLQRNPALREEIPPTLTAAGLFQIRPDRCSAPKQLGRKNSGDTAVIQQMLAEFDDSTGEEERPVSDILTVVTIVNRIHVGAVLQVRCRP